MLGVFPLPSTPGRQKGTGGNKEKKVAEEGGLTAVRAAVGGTDSLGLEETSTSNRKTLLPGFIGCFGVSLEPQLSLGMDLIAVRLDCSEGLHGDILQEESATKRKRVRPYLSHSSDTVALAPQEDMCKGKIRRINSHIFIPNTCFCESILTQLAVASPH